MKKIGVLGSTGSIGKNTLEVVKNHPEEFKILYLTANRQVELLINQAKMIQPEAVCIADITMYQQLCEGLAGSNIQCFAGMESIHDLVKDYHVDIILNAIVGAAGMQSTILAAENGTDIALSNKESLVMAGELINKICTKTGTKIFPVDSEHSAIWQCLTGESDNDVERIILTGSGGPFLRRDLSTFDTITVAEALKHPNWSMGSKISIDSASMFNKGLELIEAYHLFHLDESKIDILIHPESIIHSMVQFKDGSIKAQLGVPDMKIPIQYALSYPRHILSDWSRLDLAKIGTLHFESPDTDRFPSIRLAREVLKAGGTYPAAYNIANEKAVERFLSGKISFPEISIEVEKVIESHVSMDPLSFENLLSVIKMS